MNILITGASSGIGLELTKQLAKEYKVLAVCRKVSPELEKINCSILASIDFADNTWQDKLKKEIQQTQFDLVIHNAGVLKSDCFDELNYQDIQEQFEINTLAPLKMARTLYPENLQQGGKFVIITSRMGSIADNESSSLYGYRISKCAVNMVGKNLAHDLKAKNIAVALIHPGYVKTKMTNFNGHITPQESANSIIKVIQSQLTLKSSGSFWHSDGTLLPW